MEYIDLGKNSKILMFSDIHFHEFKPFSVPTSDGIGSRFKWLLTAFESIISYAKTNTIEHIFFLGDLFHQRTLMYSIVYDKVTEVIENAAEKGIKFHFILGNHDYIYNSDTSPSIVKRIKGIDVIDEAKVYFVRNFDEKIACIPFRFSKDKLQEDLNLVQEEINKNGRPLPLLDDNYNPVLNHILLGHFELSGATVNDEYVLKDSIDPGIFEDTIFSTIFSGHVHKAQTLVVGNKKIEFIGHTLQNTFGDEKNSYGFFIYDFSKKGQEYTFIPLRKLGVFPEFQTVEFHNQEDVKKFTKENTERFETDYFRVRSYVEELKLDSVFKCLPSYTAEYMGSITGRDIEEEDQNVQFNLDINYYLNLFTEQEKKTQSLEWLDIQKLSNYLNQLLTKGNLCLR